MRSLATKSTDQLDLQALHRVRSRLVSQRTAIVNEIRAFLLHQIEVDRSELRVRLNQQARGKFRPREAQFLAC